MILSRDMSEEEHVERAHTAYDDSFNKAEGSEDTIALLLEANFHMQVAHYRMVHRITFGERCIVEPSGHLKVVPMNGAS